MEPKAFLDLAEQLSKNATNEASLRSCVSRSYFALFNFTAQFINDNVERLSHSAGDHEKVYYYLNNCGIEDIETIASNLNDLRNERNNSDYKLQLDKFRNQNTVILLFMKANMTFNSFEKIVQNSKKRKRIVKAIQEYKKATNS